MNPPPFALTDLCARRWATAPARRLGLALAYLLPCFAFTLSSPARADIIHVPSEEPTIQAALDAAGDLDWILVAAGTYTGPGNRDLDFHGKRLKVHAEADPEATIIDCQGLGRAFFFHTHEPSYCEVKGFTMRNATPTFSGPDGGAVLILGCGPTFRRCVFENNSAARGGALYAHPSQTNTLIADCTFINNQAAVSGGAVALEPGSFYIMDSSFSGNSAPQGAALSCVFDAWVTVIDCTFTDNGSIGATDAGGALFASNQPHVVLTRVTMIDNAATLGGGIYCSGPDCYLTLDHCTLFGQRAATAGGVYLADDGTAPNQAIVLAHHTIIAAGGQGEAWHCDQASVVTITCSDLFGNAGGDWTGCVAGELGVEGNIALDPLFCDPDNRDLTLADASPCAPAHSGGCELIGAWDVGCGPIAVTPASWGSIKAGFSHPR